MGHNGLPISIDLPESFFEEEVRCGYTVSPAMKRIWAVELDLLVKFDEVCRRHGIKYVALWGTALGAVRHGGFIPWDDDIDVGMDRANYEKLCAVSEEEFKYPYFFQNELTDRAYFAPLARLRNSETTGAISGFDTPDYNNGIYIDIDILDGLARNSLQWRWQNLLKHLFLMPIQAYYSTSARSRGVLKKVCCWIRPIWHIISYETWCAMYRYVRCLYTRHSDAIGISYSFKKSEWSCWITKADFNNVTMREFEFVQIPIPGHCEDYLTRCFGDYKSFPPVAGRGFWHESLVSFNPDKPFRELLAQR